MPFDEALLEPVKGGFDTSLLESVKPRAVPQPSSMFQGASEVMLMPAGEEYRQFQLPRAGTPSISPVTTFQGPSEVTLAPERESRLIGDIAHNAVASGVEGVLNPMTPPLLLGTLAAPEVAIPLLTATMAKSGSKKLAEGQVDLQQGRYAEGVRKLGDATTELGFAAAPALAPGTFTARPEVRPAPAPPTVLREVSPIPFPQAEAHAVAEPSGLRVTPARAPQAPQGGIPATGEMLETLPKPTIEELAVNELTRSVGDEMKRLVEAEGKGVERTGEALPQPAEQGAVPTGNLPTPETMLQEPSGIRMVVEQAVAEAKGGLPTAEPTLDLLPAAQVEELAINELLRQGIDRGDALRFVESLGGAIRRQADYPRAIAEKIAQQIGEGVKAMWHPDKPITANQLKITYDSIVKAITENRLSEERPGLIAGGKLEKWADATIAEGRGRLNVGLDPVQLAAYIVKGAALLERGITSAGEWAAAMIKAHGKDIRPYLATIRKEAERTREAVFNASKPKPTTPTQEPSVSLPAAQAPARAAASVAPPITPPPETPASPLQLAPEHFTTSIKNSVTAEKRTAFGMPAVEEEAARSWGTVWDDVKRTVADDPGAGQRLVNELKAKPRSIHDKDVALLLHEQVTLESLHNRLSQQIVDAADAGDATTAADLGTKLDAVSDQLLDLFNVDKNVGREQGRGLNARKMMSDENYTLVRMELAKRAARGGQKLSVDEKAELAALQDKIAKTQKAFDDYVKEHPPEGNGKPGRIELDPEAMRRKRAAAQAKAEFQQSLAQDRFAALHPIQKFFHRTGQFYDAIRALITSFDLSALLRQGRFIVMSRPLTAAKSLGPMFRALASKDAAYRVDQEILSRPNYPLYRQSKLYLAEHGQPLSKMEEAYMSNWAERIPGVAASQRAYTTFLNKLRADTFDTLSATLSRHKPATPYESEAIANYVNAATGRGSLGSFERAAVGLNRVFFAPRYVASRFQLILGQPMWRGTGRTRALVAQEYARVLAGYAAMYALYKMALPGSEIETDPRSSDAGKIRVGNTRIDPLAGMQQNTVFLTRLATGETLDTREHVRPLRDDKMRYGARTEEDVMTRYLRSKLAPVPGAMVDAITGKDFGGDPTTWGSALQHLTVPIAYSDIVKAMEDQGIPRGTALALLSIFGEGLQVYDERKR